MLNITPPAIILRSTYTTVAKNKKSPRIISLIITQIDELLNSLMNVLFSMPSYIPLCSVPQKEPDETTSNHQYKDMDIEDIQMQQFSHVSKLML